MVGHVRPGLGLGNVADGFGILLVLIATGSWHRVVRWLIVLRCCECPDGWLPFGVQHCIMMLLRRGADLGLTAGFEIHSGRA